MINYLIILLVWIFFCFYQCVQYQENMKNTGYYLLIALSYAIFAHLIWVMMSRRLDQIQTLKFSLIWDAGIVLIAYFVPLFIFGELISTSIIIGMSLIMVGTLIILIF